MTWKLAEDDYGCYNETEDEYVLLENMPAKLNQLEAEIEKLQNEVDELRYDRDEWRKASNVTDEVLGLTKLALDNARERIKQLLILREMLDGNAG